MASTWIVSVGVASCAGEGPLPTPVRQDQPTICDGSDEVRLAFADFDAESTATWAGVMAREGVRYFRVDGHCRFVAFDGTPRQLGLWSPVMMGGLTDADLQSLLDELDVQQWLDHANGGLGAGEGAAHTGVVDFVVGTEDASCGPCNQLGLDLLLRARDVTERLVDRGSPLPSEVVEVLVFDSLPDEREPRWTVEWGASQPITDFLRSRDLPPDRLGVVVDGDDVTWFSEVQRGFQTRDTDVYPRQQDGIDVGADTAHELFIRTVVPAR